jgi:hypothetical protein
MAEKNLGLKLSISVAFSGKIVLMMALASGTRMRRSRKTLQNLTIAGALALGCSFSVGTALANGGDFFQEFADRMAHGDADLGPSYFGFVRDAGGRTIAGASVTATIITSGSAMTVKADILGHYRVPGFHKIIDPDTVEISCKAPGHVQVSAARRAQRRNVGTAIETDCILATITADAS